MPSVCIVELQATADSTNTLLGYRPLPTVQTHCWATGHCRHYKHIVELQATADSTNTLLSYRPLPTIQTHCCTKVRLWRISLRHRQSVLSLHAKCPLFLFDFNHIWNLSTGFHESPRYKTHGNPSCGSRNGTCGQTDVTKLIGSLRDYTNEFENYTSCWQCVSVIFLNLRTKNDHFPRQH
jgi:hypothetical protein